MKLARSSPEPAGGPAPLHVAIIMDGNGRWARARSMPRVAGHRQGANAVRRTVEAAPSLGVSTLTLYAFSAANWQRPVSEVSALMELLETYLHREKDRCIGNGVRINVIGRRDRLAPRLVREIERTEAATAGGRQLLLRIAVDYSAREAIAAAAARCSETRPSLESFAALMQRELHSVPGTPDVDLLIRTSGERRLSDFLLWEIAYAEFVFTERLWPDFGREDLAAAVAEYSRRDRRFGRVVAAR
jgi:undecaprenyl diphosphate synthase